eukprot:667905-Amphidinium_carterae.3
MADSTTSEVTAQPVIQRTGSVMITITSFYTTAPQIPTIIDSNSPRRQAQDLIKNNPTWAT